MSPVCSQTPVARSVTKIDCYTIAIRHCHRWHETRIEAGYGSVVELAHDAHHRSGLTVEVWNSGGDTLCTIGAAERCPS